MVVAAQPVSRDLGPARVPARLSAVSALPGRQPLSQNRRRQDGTVSESSAGVVAVQRSRGPARARRACSPQPAGKPPASPPPSRRAGPSSRSKWPRGPSSSRRSRSEAPKSVEHIVGAGEAPVLRRPGDPSRRGRTAGAVRRSAVAQRAAEGVVGPGAEQRQRQPDRRRRDLEEATATARQRVARPPGRPASADSQMFFALRPSPQWDGKYTVIGQVTSGLDAAAQAAGRRPHQKSDRVAGALTGLGRRASRSGAASTDGRAGLGIAVDERLRIRALDRQPERLFIITALATALPSKWLFV